jgi:Ca-activated chloride channel family protein
MIACHNEFRLGYLPKTIGGFMKLYTRKIALIITTLFCITAKAQPANETAPISLGIVLDTSGSMGSKLVRARQVISELVKLAGSSDEFALIQASGRPVVASGFGSTAEELQTQLFFSQSKGRSAVLDGIYLGLELSRAGRNARKVLLVISDGGENSSRYTETEIRSAMSETGVRIYVVGVGEAADGPGILPQLAERSGGRYFDGGRDANLSQIAQYLVSAMRVR